MTINTHEGSDVLVFLHIPKTSGTSMLTMLMTRLNITNPCKCKITHPHPVSNACRCPNDKGHSWFYGRYISYACGVHAGWTELHWNSCMNRTLNTLEGPRHRRWVTGWMTIEHTTWFKVSCSQRCCTRDVLIITPQIWLFGNFKVHPHWRNELCK